MGVPVGVILIVLCSAIALAVGISRWIANDEDEADYTIGHQVDVEIVSVAEASEILPGD